MQPEIFLFSRTPRADYRDLFPLPPQRSDAAADFVRQRLVQLQNGRPDGVVHFFLGDDALLLRAVDSGSRDLYGRPIFSLEGVYCPARQVRQFWLCLARIVPGFWASPSVYARLMRGEDAVRVPLDDLLADFADRGRTQPQASALRRAILSADTPVPFTFDATGFHPVGGALSARGRAPWQPRERRRCRIVLAFDRREKTARLTAISLGQPSYPVLRSETVARAPDGWDFAALESAAAAMEAELDRRGWRYTDDPAPDGGGEQQ